jgi:hypothetical protein
VLCRPDEHIRRNEAAVWMKPTHQSLRPAHPSALQIDLGLIVQDELVLLDPLA